MKAFALAAAVLLLAGCSGGKDDDAQTRDDCSDTQTYNSFEQRCISDFEACHAWLDGKANAGQEKVACQVDSDGSAWLDWGFGVTDPIHVTVTDGKSNVVYENNIGNSQDRAKVTGAKGRWQLAVDFGGSTGTGEIYLWG